MINVQVHYSSSAGNLCQIDNLLIEAGVPIKKIKQALNYKLSGIAGCIASHSHLDHVKGIKDLMKAGVDCYIGRETADALNAHGHRLHIVEPMKQFEVGDWKIKPFTLIHDVPNLGFIITNGTEKILFATDTNYIPYKFTGLTHIMLGVDYDADILKDNVMAAGVDISRARRTLQNHMSFQTAIDFFNANDMTRVQGIYLLHLSNANSDEKRFKKDIQELTGRPVYIGGE